jgi:hypothetical protein|nr:MAG TPA: hypothetical protein [Caudoviricetes sp.]
MSKRDITIRVTQDCRFNVAGLTVDTLEEAFDRYDKKEKRPKSRDNWYYIDGEKRYIRAGNELIYVDMAWPGNREFVTGVASDIIRLQRAHNVKKGMGREALQIIKGYANH